MDSYQAQQRDVADMQARIMGDISPLVKRRYTWLYAAEFEARLNSERRMALD